MAARRLQRVVLATLAALACGAGIASIPDDAAAVTPACDTAATQGAAPGWRCTFADEFDGSQLNTAKWLAERTETSGYTTGPDPTAACYVDDQRNISVSGGTLKLTARKEPAPFTCKSGLGDFQTQYTSGTVSTSEGRFSQTYGRYEIRAKIPPARVKGLHTALWLWPADLTRYGPWPSSGEIDVAEMFSSIPDRAVPYIHYDTAAPDSSVTNWSCMIDDLENFHTYTLEWTSTRIKIAYDGETCLVHRYNPAPPLLAPQPFDRPFSVVITQALGVGDNAFDPQITPLPATTEVDYVRVYEADGDPTASEDVEPPETNLTRGTDGRTNDTTPTFTFASPSPDATGFICRVDGTRIPCSGPGGSHTTSPLPDGEHSFSVAARDAAGNVDQTPAIQWFAVDATPPETTLSGPSGLISDPTPTFEFGSPDSDANSAECRVDGAIVPCSGPGGSHTTSPLPDGDHSFSVAARDTAGNVDPTPATRSFTIDATAPTTTMSGPSGVITDSTPTYEFASVSGDLATFICGLDGQLVACSGGNTYTTAPLTDGLHVIAVVAVDLLGNIGVSFELRWIWVDATAPETTLSGPSGLISDPTPTFEFGSPDSDASSGVCRVDGAIVPCSGPGGSHTTSPLPDGDHSFSVAARDNAGNVDSTPATRSFTIDATAPKTTMTGPSGVIMDSTPTYEFSSVSGDATRFICGLDGQLVTCSGPGNTHTTAPLTDGLHVIAVAAVDALDNVDPSFEQRWVWVDATAPQTTVSGPSGLISDPTPTFKFGSPDPDASSAVCRVDNAIVPCSGPGPSHTTSPLPDGKHRFSVAARDTAGNVDPTPANRSFTIDATAPETTVTGPTGVITDSTPTYEFSSVSGDATRFICGLDGQLVACSGPGNTHTTNPLADGLHVIAVAAVDALGNVDPSFEQRWVWVDTAPHS